MRYFQLPRPDQAARTRRRLAALAASGLLLGGAGCIESYLPEVTTPALGYLVVDGFINGNGRSTFLLSRTIQLANTATPPPERSAKVYIVDASGLRYQLAEKASGTYQSDSLLLNPSLRYRLLVQTASNVVYQSDFTSLKVTPPIDRLDWALVDGRVQVRASAHDASAQSRYYRWQLAETWQFTSAYESKLQYKPNPATGKGMFVKRTTPIYTCWHSERPSLIAQTTTAQLSQDAVNNYVIASFSQRDERVKIRYSVLVRQYAETAEEFAYLEQLRKNTESVGTVNDPLPVQLTGNIHRVGTNSAEPVLGFVGAHTVRQQRFFINSADLPSRNTDDYETPYSKCRPNINYFCDNTGCHYQEVTDLFKIATNIPVDTAADDGGEGILSSTPDCIDCRLRGTNIRPSYW